MITTRMANLRSKALAWWKGLPTFWRAVTQTIYELGLPAIPAGIAVYAFKAQFTSTFLVFGWGFAAWNRIRKHHRQAEGMESIETRVGAVQSRLEKMVDDLEGYATGGRARAEVMAAARPGTGEVFLSVFNHGPFAIQNPRVRVFRHQGPGESTPLVASAEGERIEVRRMMVVGLVEDLPLGTTRFFVEMQASNGRYSFWLLAHLDGGDGLFAMQATSPKGEVTYAVRDGFPGWDPAEPERLFHH